MRLTQEQIAAIHRVVEQTTGGTARVHLFGSRVLDDARGGDVDLLVTLPEPVDEASWLAARLEAQISRALEGRSVDVILKAPNLEAGAIHRIAEEQGVEL